MRKPVIAGNWKLNTTPFEGAQLARDIAEATSGIDAVTQIVCPPFVGLAAVSDVLAGSEVAVGAQDVSEHEAGAYTGEVSAAMLGGLVDYVIVGHSERRAFHGETDSVTAAKALAAVAHGITPILCVGESLDVRRSGNAIETVRAQLSSSLAGFSDWNQLVLAYEPIWAIGTGEAASPIQAQEMIAGLRTELAELAGSQNADAIAILYGGSVNPENIGPFADRDDIDGALVGGASLKAPDFARIVQLTAEIAAA